MRMRNLLPLIGLIALTACKDEGRGPSGGATTGSQHFGASDSDSCSRSPIQSSTG